MYTNIIVWLIGIPLIASPFIYLLGRVAVRTASTKAASLVSQWLSLLTLIATWFAYGKTVSSFINNGSLYYSVGFIPLQVDGLSLLIGGMALLLGTLVTIYSCSYMHGEDGEEKYYAMLLVIIGAMIGLGCAADLFNLWVWFEVMALSSYLLVSFYHDQTAALEAGVKYLVQSAAGSALVLLGIALVFMETSTLNLQAIQYIAYQTPMLLAGGALFIVGFGVKAAFVPMHTWLPDAHSQAPSGISALLSGVVIEAGLVALLRAIGALSNITYSWGLLLMFFGVLNMIVGNLLALRQTQVKRLLAFSSLSRVGYMILGLGIAIDSGQVAGAAGGLFHLVNHGLMKGLAFLAVGALLYALHIANGNHDAPLMVADLAGVSRRYPLVAFTLSIGLLGLGGLPPFAGFMSKWQIFLAGIATHDQLIFWLVVIAAFNSVLSLGYYAPLVNAIYRHKPSATVVAGQRVPVGMQLPLVLLALAIVVLGLWPTLISWLTTPAGNAIITTFGG